MVLSGKLADLWLRLFSRSYQSPINCLPPKFIVFESTLKLELPYTLFQVKSFSLGRAWEFSVLTACLSLLNKTSEPPLHSGTVAHFLRMTSLPHEQSTGYSLWSSWLASPTIEHPTISWAEGDLGLNIP